MGTSQIGQDGKLCQSAIPSVKEADYSNAIGPLTLTGYWKDPAFDAKQRAFQTLRVLEIPTPRWTTFDERVYSAPIWYTLG